MPARADPAGALARIAGLAPASLALFGDRLAPGPGGPGAHPAAALRDPAVFEAAVGPFAASLGTSDRRAAVSYWSQFYLAALVIPALTALARLGSAPPLALDAVGVAFDATGRLARVHVPEAPWCGAGPGLAALIEGHLRPFADLCHAHSGLARRVVWGNAAVLIDGTAAELRALAPRAPVLREHATVLGWRAGRASDMSPVLSPLADALRAFGPEGAWRRRVCCLRYRLPGVADCGSLCPVRHPSTSRPDPARTDRPC